MHECLICFIWDSTRLLEQSIIRFRKVLDQQCFFIKNHWTLISCHFFMCWLSSEYHKKHIGMHVQRHDIWHLWSGIPLKKCTSAALLITCPFISLQGTVITDLFLPSLMLNIGPKLILAWFHFRCSFCASRFDGQFNAIKVKKRANQGMREVLIYVSA